MANYLTKSFATKQKTKLEAEHAKILGDIEELQKDDPFADPEHANDNAAIDTDVREQIGHDTITAEIKDLKRKLSDIELALAKIKDGRYGYCEKHDDPIPLKRLELVPEARFCVTK